LSNTAAVCRTTKQDMMFGTVRARGLALLGALVLAGCEAAHASAEPAAPGVYFMSLGRSAALVAALLGLTSVVIGGRALARSAGRIPPRDRRRRASLALAAGLLGIALGGLVVATAPGGIGTGNGLGGGIVAMGVGLIGMLVGGLALARARSSGAEPHEARH
jgi:hypothetical protein